MTMLSFEILPRGPEGWTSGVLDFGRHTTLLLGGNGTGKTPIMRALAFVLGQPVQVPPLVQEKCAGARLVLEAGGQSCALERSFDTQEWLVNDGQTNRRIISEKDFAAFLLPELGVTPRTLRGKNDQPTPPYLSTVGPMFVVNQDSGWLSGYVPYDTHQFIKDQEEEVIRWMLDLPQRRRVIDKAEYNSAQIRLGSIQEQIKIKRDALSSLSGSLGEDRDAEGLRRLVERRDVLKGEFQSAYEAVSAFGRGAAEVDTNVQGLREARQATSFKLANLKRRRAQLAGVQAELGAEMQALEQNETAAEVFRAYCGNAACSLFRKPDESYGRRVLYVKDQLKDFASNAGEVEREVMLLDEQMAAIDRELASAANERRERLAQSEASAALEKLQGLTSEVAKLQARIDAVERVEALRGDLEGLLAQEQRAAEIADGLRPTRGPQKDMGRVLNARVKLAKAFSEWMGVLRTPNVSHDVSVDEELRYVIGAERFRSGSSHSGSTRTRLVLAFHASVLEVSIDMEGSHPLLLVLDAPRQHELTAADLREFVRRFVEKARSEWRQSPQLILSATDPHVVPEGLIDIRWEPRFVFGNERRFLGPVDQL